MKADRCKVSIWIAFLSGLVFVSFPVAAAKFSDWSEPVNLGRIVNSEFDEFLPAISRDGRSLYFTSTRPGGFGGEDIWVSQRTSRDATWGTPMNLGPIVNSAGLERSPGLSRDGHYLFFATNRPGGFGSLDIWVSWRANKHDDFGWQPPVNLGQGVNSPASDFGPTYFENNDAGIRNLFFASSRPGGAGGIDIYVSALAADGSFGPAQPVRELNSPNNDFRPTISRNGLELFFDSSRPGPGPSPGRDLWVSTRRSVGEPWSTPVNLGSPVNTAEFDEALPALSSNGRELFFSSSNRPGGVGGSDLYLSTRTRPKKAEKRRLN